MRTELSPVTRRTGAVMMCARVLVAGLVAAVVAAVVVGPDHPGASASTLTTGVPISRHATVDRLTSVASSIRAALAAGRRGDPLPRPLVNEKYLKKDVWQQWWTCAVDFDHYRHRICPLGDRHADRTVVVYGDSHAGMWLPVFDQLGTELGFRVVPLVKFACAPFDVPQRRDGRPYASCPRFRRWAEQKIAGLDPAMIVLGYRGFWAVHPAPGRTVAATWRTGTRTALHRLTGQTPRLVVLGDVPSRPTRPKKCLSAPHVDMGTCTIPVEAKVVQANRITAGAAATAHARFVVTQNLVCALGRCPLVVNRIITYRDPSHLSMTWTARVTAAVRSRVHPPGA